MDLALLVNTSEISGLAQSMRRHPELFHGIAHCRFVDRR
jgi:hypothetical protein